MALILAIEPDAQQASHLANLIRSRVGADLVLTKTTEQALAAIGDRVPDLILVPALLSPQDDATLAAALRVIAAAAHVQMLTIPALAVASHQKPRRGLLARWRRSSPESDEPGGCDPATFGDQIAAYLVEAALDRVPAARDTAAPTAAIADDSASVEAAAAAAREEAELEREAATREQAAREAAVREDAELEREAAAREHAAREVAAREAELEREAAAAAHEEAARAAAAREAAELELETAAREEAVRAAAALEVAAREAAVLEAETLALEAAARETAALGAAALEAAELEATLHRLTVELSRAPLEPEPILHPEIDQPAVYEVQGDELWQDIPIDDALVVEPLASERPIERSGQLDLIELPVPLSFGSRCAWIELVDVVEITPGEALSRAEEPLAIDTFEQERLELWMPLACGPQRAWPRLEGVPVEAFDRMPAPVEFKAPIGMAPVVAPIVEAVIEVVVAPVIEPVVAAAIEAVVAPVSEPVAAAANVPAVPAPDQAPPARPEWLELIESLRLDVERLRTERADPAAVVTPPVVAADAAPKVPKRIKSKKPLQDEWGFFDPEQCGFAALLAKLDEITQGTDESSARPG